MKRCPYTGAGCKSCTWYENWSREVLNDRTRIRFHADTKVSLWIVYREEAWQDKKSTLYSTLSGEVKAIDKIESQRTKPLWFNEINI